MTQTHPLTPPDELRRQWLDDDDFTFVSGTYDLLSITRDRLNSIMDQAARWGADQELEACLGHLFRRGFSDADILRVRAARRPKPPELVNLEPASSPAADRLLDLQDRIQMGSLTLAEALKEIAGPKSPSLKERIAAAITDGDERTALSLLNEALPND